jgi:hypothetical protein
MLLLLLLWPQHQYYLLLQINMEGMKDFKGDGIKLDEDSNNQLSSTICVEQGEIKIEEDFSDHSSCVADVTIEEIKVEEHPSDQLSSAVYVKQEEVNNEEISSLLLPV